MSSLQSNEFLHLYFSSVSPPSSADADLSPAEEEISSPAADLKSDNKSDDESDDTPSVWNQRDVSSSTVTQTNFSHTNSQKQRQFFFLPHPGEGSGGDTCLAVISVTSWPGIRWTPKQLHYVSVNSSNRTIKSRADGLYLETVCSCLDNQVQL